MGVALPAGAGERLQGRCNTLPDKTYRLKVLKVSDAYDTGPMRVAMQARLCHNVTPASFRHGKHQVRLV